MVGKSTHLLGLGAKITLFLSVSYKARRSSASAIFQFSSAVCNELRSFKFPPLFSLILEGFSQRFQSYSPSYSYMLGGACVPEEK